MDEVIAFVENSNGPEGYSAIFEATTGNQEGTPAGGYLYVCVTATAEVVRHLEIYKHSASEIRESDIELFWSSDHRKCGVAIWGRMRGVIDIKSGRKISAALDNPAISAIIDDEWLEGFESYLDRQTFIEARQRFWQEKAKQREDRKSAQIETKSPIETNFVVYTKGPSRLFGVFEDDGDTGYLYVLDGVDRKILQRLQIYDDARLLSVNPEDVQVVWSDGGNKCGVLIWNKMRGIIDLAGKREGRVKLENRGTSGISDSDWLNGFLG
jgi:hypothetical protein